MMVRLRHIDVSLFMAATKLLLFVGRDVERGTASFVENLGICWQNEACDWQRLLCRVCNSSMQVPQLSKQTNSYTQLSYIVRLLMSP
jgi:hypothetical protein